MTETLRLLWCAVIIEARNGQTLLLARRGHSEEIDGGLYCAPGGKVRQGETLRKAAMRECQEETGCRLIDPYEIGYYDDDPRGIVHFVGGTLHGEPQRTEPDRMGPWQMVYPDGVGVQAGIRAFARKEYIEVVRIPPGHRQYLLGGR